MDCTPYINAGASALGGTVTALAVIAFFGKYLFDNWFKKDYRRWELASEERQKENFRLLDDKLNKVAAKEEVRFSHYFVTRAEASQEIYKQGSETQTLAGKLLYAKTLPLNERTQSTDDELKSLAKEYQDKAFAFAGYTTSVRFLFDERTNDLIGKYIGYLTIVMYTEPAISHHKRIMHFEDANNRLIEMGRAFKDFFEGKGETELNK